jgi:cytochrome c553
MNRAYPAVVKSLFVVLLATAASFANAAEAQPAVKADPAKGEALFNTGDASRNITACIACHGAAGNSTIAQNPKLAGQGGPYIHKQLEDFKGAARNNPVMTPIAKALNQQDVDNLIAYLARQKAAPGAAKNKDTIELGKKIFRGGIAEKSIPACASCHSADGHGIPSQFPRLAGQHQDYTAAQLTAFRGGARKNSEQMSKIASRMSDQEIQAVADYMAGLK